MIEILYECKEKLGIVSQVDFMKITGYKFSRQNLNLDMLSGKIKYIEIGWIKYPIINNFEI